MYKLEIPNKSNIQNKEYRCRLQQALVSAAFAIVALIFFILNIVSRRWVLSIVTLVLSILSALTTAFSFFSSRLFKPSRYLFLAVIFIIFTYFLCFGGTEDGYSIYWLLLLPFCAMMIYGWKVGSLASGTMLIEIIVIAIIHKISPSTLPFTHPMTTFYIRFPFTYAAAFFLAFLFEFIKNSAFNANEQLIKKVVDSANTDTLTGLKNRNWLKHYVKEHESGFDTSVGVMMIDLDNFKQANDLYGHYFGDDVLVAVSSLLLDVKDCCHAIRWGGDEFVLICDRCDYKKYKEFAEKLRTKSSHIIFKDYPDYHQTLSIGLVVCGPNKNISLVELIDTADGQASLAKTNGKNRVYSIFCDK